MMLALVDQVRNLNIATVKWVEANMTLIPRVSVVLGVIFNSSQNKVLVAKRPEWASFAGYWEFPGGKVEPGETTLHALTRELAEEIGIEVIAASWLMQADSEFSDRVVELHVFRVSDYQKQPLGCEGQQLEWISADDLLNREFPPGNMPIIERISADLRS